MATPRALFGNFPLGRPLGKPGDAEFQHDVLARAFATLTESSGPVLIDHPEEILADDTAMSCSMPPRFDADLHPAIDEANGIRKAFDRTHERRGVTSVGRAVDPDGITGALEAMVRLADGVHWKEADVPGGNTCLLYTSPSPRDATLSRMPSSA